MDRVTCTSSTTRFQICRVSFGSFLEWLDEINFLTQELLWVLLGLALLYGLFYLARRRPYEFSADLVGLGVAGTHGGWATAFFGNACDFLQSRARGDITAILLAPTLTLFLDDAGFIPVSRRRPVFAAGG